MSALAIVALCALWYMLGLIGGVLLSNNRDINYAKWLAREETATLRATLRHILSLGVLNPAETARAEAALGDK